MSKEVAIVIEIILQDVIIQIIATENEVFCCFYNYHLWKFKRV
jgi:hypothetical protein